MGGALRILQAGELCLDEPLRGFSSDLPNIFQHSGTQSNLVDARYQAARNFFEAAISEQVDLILLAGKLCTHENDPRPYWFLKEQFTQLLKHRIAVVCAETTNSFRWPSTISLPENVSVVYRHKPTEIETTRMSQAISFNWDKEDQSHESENACYQNLTRFSVQLHESGGCITSVSYRSSSNNKLNLVPAHTLQANSLSEPGPFQGTLVEFDDVTGFALTPVRTEAVACETWQFDIQQNESLEHLRNRLVEKICDTDHRRGLSSVPTLLCLSLSASSLSESKLFTFSPRSQKELLSTIQHKVREKQLKIWPCRVEIEPSTPSTPSTPSQQFFTESLPIQIALHELEEIDLSDLNGHLGHQPIPMNQKSLPQLKSRVALRIPNLLAE